MDVREGVPPDDGAAPVHWERLTSRPIETLEQAVDLLDADGRGWIIVLRQSQDEATVPHARDGRLRHRGDRHRHPAVMERFAAAATLASVTILQMVRARDAHTDEPLEQAFAAEDRPLPEAVRTTPEGKTARQKNPHRRGSLAYATRVIARPGSWTGSYGKPGPQVLRRGLDTFRAIKLGATLRPPDVRIR